MPVFKAVFGVPAGYTLREVRSSPQARDLRHGIWGWEHEEYDERGVLVAVYESWTRSPVPRIVDGADDIVSFVKYSPYGWVLRHAGTPPVRQTGSAANTWWKAA